MTQFTFITSAIGAAVKPVVSGIVSVALALSPYMPQNMENTVELTAKALSHEKIHVSVIMTMEITEDENPTPEISEANFEICFDPASAQMNIFGSEEDIEGTIFVSPNGFAFDSETSQTVCDLYEEFGGYGTYGKYFDGKSIVVPTVDLLSEYVYYYNVTSPLLIGDKEFLFTEESVKASANMLDDMFGYLSEDDSAKAIIDMSKTELILLEKYFSKEERDGKDGYCFYMDGIDLFTFLSEDISIRKGDEYKAAAKAIADGALENFNAEEYAKAFFGEDASEEEINALNKAYTDAVASFFDTFPDEDADILQRIVKMLGDAELMETGFEPEILFNGEAYDFEDYMIYLAAVELKPMLENTYFEYFIYPKDENVGLDLEIAVYDGYTEIINAECVFSACDHEIVPFEDITDTFTIDEFLAKSSFEAAKHNGIFKAEINWQAAMEPGDTQVGIANEILKTWYLNEEIKSITASPVFPEMSEENRKNIISLVEEKYKYDSDTYAESDVVMIDGSTYLPLRQISEACGLDVEWDDAERKAYVITENGKVDMTGIIIDDKTYVKVRDFEKLGVTVDYSEDVYYGHSFDDFFKRCTVKLIFVK